MSPAGDTDDESRESERSTVTTTPVGGDAASGGDSAHEGAEEHTVSTPVASTTAPWQRAGVQAAAGSGGARNQHQDTAYRTYGDDGYGSEGERSAAQYSEQREPDQQPPLLTGTAAAGYGNRQGAGRSAIDIGAQSTAGQQAADGAATGRGPTPTALRRPGRGPRRASLQLKRFDPWSVLKLALVLCIAMFFVWMVAVGLLYGALDGMGVWDKINGTYSSLTAPKGGGSPLISPGSVFGVAAIIGAINIILFTALATIGAFVYNVCADFVGGLEVTLAERE